MLFSATDAMVVTHRFADPTGRIMLCVNI